jgi:hypothetical protein
MIFYIKNGLSNLTITKSDKTLKKIRGGDNTLKNKEFGDNTLKWVTTHLRNNKKNWLHRIKLEELREARLILMW